MASALATLFHTIGAHTSDVTSVAFSTEQLASSSSDKTVRLWNLEDFSEAPCSPLCGHSYNVHSCAFSPFGTVLASCSTDGKCILWDVKSGEKIGILEHKSKGSIRICRFSRNGAMLATGGDDEKLCVWDVASRKLLRTFDGHEASVNCCMFSPDGAFLISGSSNGDLRIWDALYGSNRNLFLELEAHDLGVTCCDYSPTYGSAAKPDNNLSCQVLLLLATAGFDHHVKLWDFLSYIGGSKVELSHRATLKGHEASVMAVSFNSTGLILASCSGDKTIMLWNPITCKCLQIIDGHSRYVTSCAFSMDGCYLATGSNDKHIKIWKITSEDQYLGEMKSKNTQIVRAEVNCDKSKKLPCEWSVTEVCQWLYELGMGQYEATFKRNAIDGMELTTLNHYSLEKDLGISALGHRNKILRAIKLIETHPEIQPRSSNTDDTVPDEYLCPITREIMRDPVIAADGYSYERSAIVAWINNGRLQSPMTNALLSSRHLTPNRSLKMLIQKYIQSS